MTARAKTIQIFLPAGDPRGIRIAEITTRIVQVIEVPRSLLADFLAMPEGTQVALYFLVGETEDGSEDTVYVGQTGDLRARLTAHNKEKDFWERALVLISRTNSLTQTHALFLEWHCLQAIRTAGRFRDENGNKGNRPFTPPPLEADCLEIFETGQALVSTLGYPMFDALVQAVEKAVAPVMFHCQRRGADGRGYYTADGFVVLRDSSGPLENTASQGGTQAERLRAPLIASGVLVADGKRLRFTRDHLFRTPSGAASVLLGRSANGWIEWMTESRQTLDAIERQKVSAQSAPSSATTDPPACDSPTPR
jgi:predicted GIY-YIG superfamily endonuclease